MKNKKAVLLVNLGSPDSTSVKDVRRYLDEFLMDKYVIDVPYLLRLLIVKCFVLPLDLKNLQKHMHLFGGKNSFNCTKSAIA